MKFATILALLMLGGCMSVPLSSLPALSRIDFATTNLEKLRVAVTLPDAIRPRADGVKMEATRKVGDAPEQKDIYLLTPADSSDGAAPFPGPTPAGFTTYAYRLAPAERQRFEAMRAQMMEYKRQGKRGSLTLGIEVKEFCRLRALPKGKLPVSTYLLTSETGRYVALTDKLDLRDEEDIAKELDKLDPC